MRLAVLCAFVIAVAGLAACGDSGSEDATVAIASESPKGLVEAANLNDVHSGEIEGAFEINHQSKRGQIGMHLAGEFEGLGEGGLPNFFIAVSSQGQIGGRRVDFNGRLGLLPSQAVFVYGLIRRELPYQPDKATFKELKSKFEEAQEEGGKGDVTACLRSAEEVDLARLISNLKSEGRREESDGTRVFLVGGEVDVPRVIALLIHSAEDPACGAQMQALGLPSIAELETAERKGQVEEAPVTLAVDRRGVLHDLSARLDWKDSRGESIELRLEFRLSKVNEGTEIYLSSSSQRPLDALLRMFGTSQAKALQASGAELVVGFLKGLGGGLTGQLPAPRP